MKPVHLPFSKFVLPIDKKVFRLHILKCLAFQVLMASVVYIFLKNREVNYAFFNNWDDYYLAWFANLAMLVFVYDLNMFRARFKDIYPDQELNKIFYFFVGFVPVFFFAMIIFLCVKNSDSGDSYPRAFRKRYALLGLLPLLALQGQFPKVGFWTASPSSYYLVDTLHQSERIEEIKKTTAIEEALAARPGAVTIMALVWKASLDLHKTQNRTIASVNGDYVDSFKDSFKFLRTCHEAIRITEDNNIRLTDFSPIHWLHPMGPVDIFMAHTLDQGIREKAAWQLYSSCSGILDKLEWHYDRLKLNNEDYKKQISELKTKYAQTRMYEEWNKVIAKK